MLNNGAGEGKNAILLCGANTHFPKKKNFKNRKKKKMKDGKIGKNREKNFF